MKAWRDRDYLKCPGCGYILAIYRRGPVLHLGPVIETRDVEWLRWRQGWRENDRRLTMGRTRHGREPDPIAGQPRRRIEKGNSFPDAREALCPSCGEVVDLLPS